MEKFSLTNASSINLNFLIFIQNLYENYNDPLESTKKFPWLPLEKNLLLNHTELKIKIKELWSTIFNYDCLNEKDIEFWANGKFPFEKLFYSNSIGVECYEKIKKSFESWYWGIGYNMCIEFSNVLVEEYYNKLVITANLKNFKLKDNRFYLQVLYDITPEDWDIKNNSMIILSPQKQLPLIEEILYICSIN